MKFPGILHATSRQFGSQSQPQLCEVCIHLRVVAEREAQESAHFASPVGYPLRVNMRSRAVSGCCAVPGLPAHKLARAWQPAICAIATAASIVLALPKRACVAPACQQIG